MTELKKDWGPEGPPTEELIALIKAIGPIMATGDTALGVALLIHEMDLDDSGQWGCAYFRCPECKQAHDCDGGERWDGQLPHCGGPDEEDRKPGDPDCSHEFSIEDLQISEGWIEGLT
jgi:hypothetical protein